VYQQRFDQDNAALAVRARVLEFGIGRPMDQDKALALYRQISPKPACLFLDAATRMNRDPGLSQAERRQCLELKSEFNVGAAFELAQQLLASGSEADRELAEKTIVGIVKSRPLLDNSASPGLEAIAVQARMLANRYGLKDPAFAVISIDASKPTTRAAIFGDH
jgi:hypothetical protein